MTTIKSKIDRRQELIKLWSKFSKTKKAIYHFIRKKNFYLSEVYHNQTTIGEAVGCERETSCRLIKQLKLSGFIKEPRKKYKTLIYELTDEAAQIDFQKVDEKIKAEKEKAKKEKEKNDTNKPNDTNNSAQNLQKKNVNKSSFPSVNNKNVTETESSYSLSMFRNDITGNVDKRGRKIAFFDKEDEILEELRRDAWIADERFQSLGTYFSREIVQKWKKRYGFEAVMATFDLLKVETQRRIDKNLGLLDNAEAWFQAALSGNWANERENTKTLKERNRRKAFSGIKRFVHRVCDHYAVFKNGVKLYFNETVEFFDREFENQKIINTWEFT
jgi:hypothetical protein